MADGRDGNALVSGEEGAQPQGAPSVFVSYRRDDEGWFADRVAEECKQAFGADRVFMDLRAISPGDRISGRIDSAIREATAVLVVIGPQWAGTLGTASRLLETDDWVRREIVTALETDTPVVPVLTGGASMPRPEDLPEVLRPIGDLNAISISLQSRDDDLKRLILSIWDLWAADHDIVVLSDGTHDLLVQDFVNTLQGFAKETVVDASRLAAGLAVLDFRDEQQRPLLVALLPDADEWDDVNERVQRLLKSRRFARLLLVGTSASTGYLLWNQATGRPSGGEAAEMVDVATSTTQAGASYLDLTHVTESGRIVGEPGQIAEAFQSVAEIVPELGVTTGNLVADLAPSALRTTIRSLRRAIMLRPRVSLIGLIAAVAVVAPTTYLLVQSGNDAAQTASPSALFADASQWIGTEYTVETSASLITVDGQPTGLRTLRTTLNGDCNRGDNPCSGVTHIVTDDTTSAPAARFEMIWSSEPAGPSDESRFRVVDTRAVETGDGAGLMAGCNVGDSTRLGGIGLRDPDPPPYFGATPITEAWVVESDGLIVKASPTDIGCFARD